MDNNKSVGAIIVAAGKGKRMGKEYNKQYILLYEKPIIVYTLEIFEKSQYIDDIILVVGQDEVDFAKEEIIKRYGLRKISKVIGGGKERQDSVYKGLLAIKDECDIVLIHDGARPFVQEKMIMETINIARERGAAIVAVPVKDTIKRVNPRQEVIDTPNRKELWSVQTPQTFQYSLLKKAYDKIQDKNIIITDDAMAVEGLGHPVKIVEGSYENIKITTPEDLIIAERILNKEE